MTLRLSGTAVIAHSKAKDDASTLQKHLDNSLIDRLH